MNIEELLNKYFEGETSSEEEQQLRIYFSSGEVPEHLTVYKPLFAYIEEEIKEFREKQSGRFRIQKQRIFYLVSSIAAAILLIIGLNRDFLWQQEDPCICEGSYVVINGICYTDPDQVRLVAFDALQEVATPATAYFPEETETSGIHIIRDQLQGLGSLFSEDE